MPLFLLHVVSQQAQNSLQPRCLEPGVPITVVACQWIKLASATFTAQHQASQLIKALPGGSTTLSRLSQVVLTRSLVGRAIVPATSDDIVSVGSDMSKKEK